MLRVLSGQPIPRTLILDDEAATDPGEQMWYLHPDGQRVRAEPGG